MDARTPLEKLLWKVLGPPLYYCDTCLKHVDVKVVPNKDGQDVKIKRFCDHEDAKIIAPRKAVVSGKGFAGLSTGQKIKAKLQQGGAALTGRNV